MDTFVEKRKSQRVDSHVPVKFRKLGSETEIFNGSTVTKDLSEGGVRFNTSEFVSRACRLIVEIDVPMFAKPVKAISKVAWIRKANNDGYELGNQFLEISKEDKGLLSEYVKGMSLYNEPLV